MIKLRKTLAAKKTSTASGAASLTIDYSNGVRKSFVGIPCTEETDVLEVLQAAGAIKPGLVFKFTVTLVSDRVGRKRGFISLIDGVKADQKNQIPLKAVMPPLGVCRTGVRAQATRQDCLQLRSESKA